MSYHGYAALAPRAPLVPFAWEPPAALGDDEVEIAITHCGLCHSDLHLIDNAWRVSRFPLVPGHEIVGTVVRRGAAVVEPECGARVGVGWQSSSCGRCAWCLSGEDQFCPDREATAIGRHGGMADRVVATARLTYLIPDALSSEAAAPLLCAGATVYDPLRRYAKPGSSVGVLGVGGLGHLAVQFARAMQCEVTAFSTHPEKEREILQFGASRVFSTRDGPATAAETLDLLLVTVHQDLPWRSWLDTLKPRGVLCFVGGPPQALGITAGQLIHNARSVVGSAVTGSQGMREMLAFAAEHAIFPVVEALPMSEVQRAVDRLRAGDVRYRFVLRAGE